MRINLLRFASTLLILCFFTLLASETSAQEVTPVISSVAWSPDGSMIAVGYGTGQCVADRLDLYVIEIIDAATNQVLHTLSGAECRVMALEWSPDGSKLASASLDAIGIRIWDMVTGQLLVTKQFNLLGAGDVNWSPEGTVLAFTDEFSESVMTLDAMTGEIINQVSTYGTSVDWSSDGSNLVSGSAGKNDIFISDPISGQESMILIGHTASIQSVDWSPDGAKLASGSNDNTVRIWDVATGNLLLTLEGHTDFVTTVVWSPDSRHIASGSADGTIRVWDAETGEQVAIVQETNSISAVAWSPDGTQIAYSVVYGVLETIDTPPLISCTATIPAADTPALLSAIISANGTPEPDTICLEAGTYTLDAPITSDITLHGLGSGAQEVEINQESLQIVAWQPVENGLLAIGSRQSESIWIYDSQLNLITTLSLDERFLGFAIRWNPSGNRLAVYAQQVGSGKVYVWEQDQPNSFVLQTVVDLTERASEHEFAWSPDGTRIAVIVDLRAEIWDAATGQLLQRIGTPMGPERSGNATDVAWSPDGTRIAISTDGYYIHIVDAGNYQLLTSIVASAEFGVGPILWSPDNTLLAAARIGTITVFDANTYKQVISVENGGLFIDLMDWQGDYLAVAGSQPEIIIWDTTQWEMNQSIPTSDLAVLSISWKPNSTILAYGGYTSTTITLIEAVPTTAYTICLEAGTYTLNAPITSEITLVGLGAGAQISGTLQVSSTGRLTLRNVSVSR